MFFRVQNNINLSSHKIYKFHGVKFNALKNNAVQALDLTVPSYDRIFICLKLHKFSRGRWKKENFQENFQGLK
jgi:hypothetical protein